MLNINLCSDFTVDISKNLYHVFDFVLELHKNLAQSCLENKINFEKYSPI